MDFSHFVITQFNLKRFARTGAQSDSDWIEWTKNRIELFKQYCLPSVLNQTEKQFKWLIFFDHDTPKYFLTFLNELEAFTFVKVCFCNGLEAFESEYMAEVRLLLKSSDRWVVTTRLDNDDMLHRGAIKIIQQNVHAKNGFMVSLASGYVFDTSTKMMAHYFYPMSPFISIVESTSENPRGIFAKLHTQWLSLRLFVFREIFLEFLRPSKRQSRFVLTQPLWIQTFHKKNVSNSFYRGFPVLKSKTLSDFGVDIKTNGLKFFELPKFANYVIWKRYVKAMIVKIIIRK